MLGCCLECQSATPAIDKWLLTLNSILQNAIPTVVLAVWKPGNEAQGEAYNSRSTVSYVSSSVQMSNMSMVIQGGRSQNRRPVRWACGLVPLLSSRSCSIDGKNVR